MNGMRSLLVVLATGLAACGGVPQNGSCTDDYQCESGLVCEGDGNCQGDPPKHCIRGCRADYQCLWGQTCHAAECFACPCPKMCW